MTTEPTAEAIDQRLDAIEADRWRWSNLRPCASLLRGGVASEDAGLRARAIATLRAIEDAPVRSAAEGEAIAGFALYTLSRDDPQGWSDAALLLGVVAERADARASVQALGARLADEICTVQVAHALRRFALAGVDLGAVTGALEVASSASLWTRYYASRALSDHLRRVGIEPGFEVDDDLRPGPYWNIEVSCRRLWAETDEAITYTPSTHRYEAARPCGACRSPHTRCVYTDDRSGTAWIQHFFEYLCEDCGRYTLYHYDD